MQSNVHVESVLCLSYPSGGGFAHKTRKIESLFAIVTKKREVNRNFSYSFLIALVLCLLSYNKSKTFKTEYLPTNNTIAYNWLNEI